MQIVTYVRPLFYPKSLEKVDYLVSWTNCNLKDETWAEFSTLEDAHVFSALTIALPSKTA
jgi:hypothetical protein